LPHWSGGATCKNGLVVDAGQAAAGIGQAVGHDLQTGHHAQLLHGAVQQTRDAADLLEHPGPDQGRSRL
jgi:hypothetical protein